MTSALEAAREIVASGSRGVLVTTLAGADAGAMALLDGDGSVLAGSEPPSAVQPVATRVLARGTPEVLESDDGSWFVEPVVPAPRLLVLGAIAVADALVPMAAAAGYSVTVVDPRPWLATAERYPDAVEVLCAEPAEILPEFGVDSATAVVSFLHEPRREDPVLQHALAGPAWYVGAMGSRRTTAAKLERLAALGLTEAQIERLHAPIGLDIGAVPPREIAVAVLAEIVATSRGVA